MGSKISCLPKSCQEENKDKWDTVYIAPIDNLYIEGVSTLTGETVEMIRSSNSLKSSFGTKPKTHMNRLSLSSPLARPELNPTPKFEIRNSFAASVSK